MSICSYVHNTLGISNCQYEVGNFYKKGEAPIFGAIAYFFVYLLNLGIMYAIMLVLTKIGVLPI